MSASDTCLLIKEALIQIMSEKPLPEVTVAEVIRKADVSRSTFYSYYDSLFATIQEMEDDFFEDFEQYLADILRYAAPFRDTYFQSPSPVIVAVFGYCERHRKMLSVLLNEQKGEPMFQYRIKQVITKTLFDDAVNANYIPAVDPMNRAFLIGGHYELFVYVFTHHVQLDYELAAIQIYRMLYGPYRLN